MTFIWNGALRSCHDTYVLAMIQQSDYELPFPTPEKYYLIDYGYPNKQILLASYRSSHNGDVR